MINNLLAVFIGGGLGCLFRYGISILSGILLKTTLPAGTMLSNILSCLTLSIFLLLFHDRVSANSAIRLLVLTGFCGGLSTFSAFSYESVMLFRSGNILYGLANIIINIAVCFFLMAVLVKERAA